jgi:hypothetical protein
VSFTDSHGNTVQVSLNGTQTSYTANLASLSDGTIASSVSVNGDPAGNTFAPVSGNSASLDRDIGEQAALKVTVNGGNPIGAAIAGGVPFTITGLEPDDNGTVTFSDGNAAHNVVVKIVKGVPAATSIKLSGLTDGSITATLHLANDAAGNSFTDAVTTAILDRDINEQAALKLTINGGAPIGAAKAPAAPITIAGLQTDDNGTVTVSDGNPAHNVTIAIINGVVPTANLTGLNDGPITATLQLDNDAAGNSFKAVTGAGTLDQDTGEQAALKVTVNGGAPIGAAVAGAVPFAVVGLEPDDNGTVTFSDGNTAHNVVVNIVNGVPAATSVILSGLNDGSIRATLHHNKDAAGNSFTNVVTTATLDQDLGEQAALKLTINSGAPIGPLKAVAVPTTIAGLEADDNGTLRFSDGNTAHDVTVAIVNGVVAKANLTGLNDGAITATLQLNNDAAGNSFSSVVGTATLDADKIAETPTLSVPSAVTVAAGGSIPLGIVVGGVDSDDALKVVISGVPSYETITAASATPTVTVQGATSTYTFNPLPAADWNDGLIVNSTYMGAGHPTSVLTVKVSNATNGEPATATSAIISVTDPPAGSSDALASDSNTLGGHDGSLFGISFGDTGGVVGWSTAHDTVGSGLAGSIGADAHDRALALLGQYMASSFVSESGGNGGTLVSGPQQDQQHYLSLPHAG